MSRVWQIAILGLLLVCWTLNTREVSGQSKAKGLTGAETKIEGMTSKVSDKWKTAKAEKPDLYKFTLPKTGTKDKEDGVVTVTPGLEGKDDDNVEKWKKMFTPLKGKSFEEKLQFKVEKGKVGGATYTYMDIRGDMKDGDSTREGRRMLAVMLDVNGKKVLIKAIGPMGTINSHRSDFNDWLATLK